MQLSEAAFRHRREQGSETPHVCSWRQPAADSSMQLIETALRRSHRLWRKSGFAEGNKVLPKRRRAWEQGSETH
jgi:hypothetical protein